MRNQRRSFTVIELIVVILILTVLGVTVFARIPDLGPLRLQTAAKKLQTDIRYAQSLALSLQMRTGLAFNVVADSYSLYIERTPGVWSLAANPLTKTDFTVTLNTDEFVGVQITVVYFNGYNQALVFDEWGNPYGFNVGTMTASGLNNPAGVRLVADALTQDVRVERGTGRVYLP